MSVSSPGLTALPPPGIYRDGVTRYEIRHSKRQHWYAMRLGPDGETYVAQNVDLSALLSERQPSEIHDCGESNCPLPAWHRGLCEMHMTADAVRRARSA